MKITRIRVFKTALPYVGGAYVWGAGNAIETAIASVVVIDMVGDADLEFHPEAASMQAIRRHLFDVAGADRRQCTIRGYWKPAR